ncbi:MAG: hypothetical protein ACTFAL_00240 [Candidatus Electronema sp. V4]|uniref:hypothetical protein n=1 Tax=Candidatus Electronema sp. V4 TaxID=3454756 RepID=UPI004055858E
MKPIAKEVDDCRAAAALGLDAAPSSAKQQLPETAAKRVIKQEANPAIGISGRSGQTATEPR